MHRVAHFTAGLPGDWADTTLFTFAGEGDGPRPVMTVSVDADAPDVPLADFAGAQVQAVTAGPDACELLADGPLRLGDGTAAHRAAFTWAPSPGVRLCQDQLYVLAGGRAFVLAATYPADARLALGPVVEAVLMSFVATG